MKLRTPSPAIGLVLALGSAAGCGSEEMFRLELGTNERPIDTEAFGRIARSDETVENLVVVGDLDGDGIDDAVIQSAYGLADAAGNLGTGSAVYVVYGGPGVTGQIDMATLPTLVHTGDPGFGWLAGSDLIPVGDIDGDGLADFLVRIVPTQGFCNPDEHVLGDNLQNGGAYIIYGNHTRLTGTHPIDDAGVFLRDPVPCTVTDRIDPLGDIDGDGKADFAIGRTTVDGSAPATLLVFSGRSLRLSGTVDLTTTADAVITNTARPQDSPIGPIGKRLGDVDGDGIDDFVVVSPAANTMDVRLVRGSATRLSGTFVAGDLGATQLLVHTCSPPEVDALGDLDGDGVDDFALSSCVEGSMGNFMVDYHLFYGRKGGFPAQVGADDQDATLPATGILGSTRLIGGDVDGDGTLDLILVNSSLHDLNGGMHLLKGNAGVRLSGVVDPIGRSFVTYVGQPQRDPGPCADTTGVTSAQLGWAGVAVGDLNADHHPDLMTSALTAIMPTKGGRCDTTLARVYLVSPPASPKP